MKEYLKTLPLISLSRIPHAAIPMGICIDGKFLEKHPKELMESKEYSQVPILMGTYDEGFKLANQYLTNTEGKVKGESHFSMIIEGIVKNFAYMNNSEELGNEFVQKIFKSFGPKRVKKDEEYLKSCCKIFGDMMINFPTLKFAQIHQSNAPVYLYEVHQPNVTINAPSWVNVCHGEEYRFTFGETFAERPKIQWKKEDKEFSTNILKKFNEFLHKG